MRRGLIGEFEEAMAGDRLPLEAIRERAADGSFERGRGYQRDGAVLTAIERGDRLRADILGSRGEPYRVDVSREDGAVQAACSCPDDRGGWCKHVVAVLLAIREGDGVHEERPEPVSQLQHLPAEELRGFVLDIAETHPEVLDLLEASSETVQILEKAEASLDPSPFGRTVRRLLHGGRASGPGSFARPTRTEESIEKIVDLVDRLTDGGEPRAAWEASAAAVDAYLAGWHVLHDLGGLPAEIAGSLLGSASRALASDSFEEATTEAILQRLDGWEEELGPFGLAGEVREARRALLAGSGQGSRRRAGSTE